MNQLTANLWVSQSRFYYTNAGVFVSGKEACLVDPNMTPTELAQIRQFLTEHDLHAGWLILTHYHWDHILGHEAFPAAQVIGHEALPQQLTGKQGADTLAAIAHWEAENGIVRSQPFQFSGLHRAVNPPELLNIGALDLDLLHTPGHSPDQLAIYERATATLWASDILSDIEIPFISDSLTAFEHTLDQLTTLDIQVLIPGHGFHSQDCKEIRARIAADRTYLAELRLRVEYSLARGESMAETVSQCAGMAFRNPEENLVPHRRNVESVYAELGGDIDPQHVGWGREYEGDS